MFLAVAQHETRNENSKPTGMWDLISLSLRVRLRSEEHRPLALVHLKRMYLQFFKTLVGWGAGQGVATIVQEYIGNVDVHSLDPNLHVSAHVRVPARTCNQPALCVQTHTTHR
jgi:hypothetical protein